MNSFNLLALRRIAGAVVLLTTAVFADPPVVAELNHMTSMDTILFRVRIMDAEGDSVVVRGHFRPVGTQQWFAMSLIDSLFASNRGVDTLRWPSLSDTHMYNKNIEVRIQVEDQDGIGEYNYNMWLHNHSHFLTSHTLCSPSRQNFDFQPQGVSTIRYGWQCEVTDAPLPENVFLEYSTNSGVSFRRISTTLDSIDSPLTSSNGKIQWRLPIELEGQDTRLTFRLYSLDTATGDTLLSSSEFAKTTTEEYVLNSSPIWDAWIGGQAGSQIAELEFPRPIEVATLTTESLSNFTFGVQVDSITPVPQKDTITVYLEPNILNLNSKPGIFDTLSDWYFPPGTRVIAAKIRSIFSSYSYVSMHFLDSNSNAFRTVNSFQANSSYWLQFPAPVLGGRIRTNLTNSYSYLSTRGTVFIDSVRIERLLTHVSRVRLHLSDTLLAGLVYRDTLRNMRDLSGNEQTIPIVAQLKPYTTATLPKMTFTATRSSNASSVLFTLKKTSSAIIDTFRIEYRPPDSSRWIPIIEREIFPETLNQKLFSWDYSSDISGPLRQGYLFRAVSIGGKLPSLYSDPVQLGTWLPNLYIQNDYNFTKETQRGDTIRLSLRIHNSTGDSVDLNGYYSYERRSLRKLTNSFWPQKIPPGDTTVQLNWAWADDIGFNLLEGMFNIYLHASTRNIISQPIWVSIYQIPNSLPLLEFIPSQDTIRGDTVRIPYRLHADIDTQATVQWSYSTTSSTKFPLVPLGTMSGRIGLNWDTLCFVPGVPADYLGPITLFGTPSTERNTGPEISTRLFMNKVPNPTLEILGADYLPDGNVRIRFLTSNAGLAPSILSEIRWQDEDDWLISPPSEVINSAPDTASKILPYSDLVRQKDARELWYRLSISRDTASSPWDSLLIYNAAPEIEVTCSLRYEAPTSLLIAKAQMNDLERDDLRFRASSTSRRLLIVNSPTPQTFSMYNDSVYSSTFDVSDRGIGVITFQSLDPYGPSSSVDCPVWHYSLPSITLDSIHLSLGTVRDTLHWKMTVLDSNYHPVILEFQYWSANSNTWVDGLPFRAQVQHPDFGKSLTNNWVSTNLTGLFSTYDSLAIRMRVRGFWGGFGEWDSLTYHRQHTVLDSGSIPTLRILGVDYLPSGSARIRFLTQDSGGVPRVQAQTRLPNEDVWYPHTPSSSTLYQADVDTSIHIFNYSSFNNNRNERELWYRLSASDANGSSPWDSVRIYNAPPEISVLCSTISTRIAGTIQLDDPEGDILQIEVQRLVYNTWVTVNTGRVTGTLLSPSEYSDSVFQFSSEFVPSSTTQFRFRSLDPFGASAWVIYDIPQTTQLPVIVMDSIRSSQGTYSDTLFWKMTVRDSLLYPVTLELEFRLQASLTWNTGSPDQSSLLSSELGQPITNLWRSTYVSGRLNRYDSLAIRVRARNLAGFYSEWDTLTYYRPLPQLDSVSIVNAQDTLLEIHTRFTAPTMNLVRMQLWYLRESSYYQNDQARDTSIWVQATLPDHYCNATSGIGYCDVLWPVSRDVPPPYRTIHDSLRYRIILQSYNPPFTATDTLEGVYSSHAPELDSLRVLTNTSVTLYGMRNASRMGLRTRLLDSAALPTPNYSNALWQWHSVPPSQDFLTLALPPYGASGNTSRVLGDSVPLIIDLYMTNPWQQTFSQQWRHYISLPPADLNRDGYLDFMDIDELATHWVFGRISTELAPYEGDFSALRVTPDGVFDYQDVRVFAQSWLREQSRVPNPRLRRQTPSDSPFFTRTRTAFHAGAPQFALPRARWERENSHWVLRLPNPPQWISGGAWVQWAGASPVQKSPPPAAFVEQGNSQADTEWLWYGFDPQGLGVASTILRWDGAEHPPSVRVHLLGKDRHGNSQFADVSPNALGREPAPEITHPVAEALFLRGDILQIPCAGLLTVEIWSLNGERLSQERISVEAGKLPLAHLLPAQGLHLVRIVVAPTDGGLPLLWTGWRVRP